MSSALGGSSSLFILEVANQLFLVRGIQTAEQIHIWVAFHGDPDTGRIHQAEIEFNFQEDEPVNRDLHQGPAAIDYGRSGAVVSST